jgi:SAM-dependent methyltransferase
MTSPGRKYLRFPAPAYALSRWQLALHLLRGAVLFPVYWLAALVLGSPGMGCRWRCLKLGLTLLGKGDFANAYRCIVWPLDSVRYFEFDFFWQVARRSAPTSMLDVSSPRLFMAMLLAARPALRIEAINPDAKDLQRSAALMATLGLSGRCQFSGRSVAQVAADTALFDLVTCMSVLEHIVDDMAAVAVMWSKVAPGGRLVLSMPCARSGMDEFTNVDEYGLLDRDLEGFVFWQRYYDPSRLDRVFAITGMPVTVSVFGELVEGRYDADVLRKRTDPAFPRWREPYNLVRSFGPFADLAGLPGMGVIAMEFHKLSAPATQGPT